MMGDRKVQQDALFYEFSLERHVPEKHLLRAIDALSNSAAFEHTWRPSTVKPDGLRLIPNC